MKNSYVYILSSRKQGSLYIGVTSDLMRRVFEHREKLKEGHSRRYNITMLVYYEIYDDIESAIIREKRLKVWQRDWKIRLINKFNPEWRDLFKETI